MLRRLLMRALGLSGHAPHAIYECQDCGTQVGVRVDTCPDCDSNNVRQTTP